MSQVLDFPRGNLLFKSSNIQNFTFNSLKIISQKSCFPPRNRIAIKNKKCRAVLFPSAVSCKLVDQTEHSLEEKDSICDGGKFITFPHVQSLTNFPKEELFQKVVMVRFDSVILLQEKLEHQSPPENAVYTIKYLYEAGAKVILVSSWNENTNSGFRSEAYPSTESVADFLSSVLGMKVVPVKFVLRDMHSDVKDSKISDVLLLENLFHFKGEVANCSKFAKELASGVDIIVNDAFSQSHKVLASTVGVASFCYAYIAGFYFEEGLYKLKKIMKTTERPYMAIVGGGKLSDKAAALRYLASKCDGLVFVGSLAFQIMHALGVPLPMKLVEIAALKEAVSIVESAKSRNIPLVLPKDIWCSEDHNPQKMEIFSAHSIREGWQPVDIGPRSLEEMMYLLSNCKAYPFQVDWSVVYSDPTRPLVVDVGSGNGMFLFGMARRRKSMNFLGLEMNAKLVDRCLDDIHRLGDDNVYFIATNATSTFRSIVSNYPGELVLMSIQCPNPDFNKPEYRWRMLQRSLVEAIADTLIFGGKVFLQSDIEAVALRMKKEFIEYGKGKLVLMDHSEDVATNELGWLEENPFGVPSDWEQHVLDRGDPMYRLLLSKVENGG